MKITRKIQKWQNLKYFLIFLLPPFSLLFLVSAVVFIIQAESHKSVFKEKEVNHVNQISTSLANDFNMALSSLLFLADQHEIRRLLDGEKSEMRDLEEMFLTFSTRFGLFDQIRFIDDSGMEMVRINFNDKKPDIVPQNKMQLKKNRYYFKETMRLDKGEVFVSPLDLNKEGGKIERPLKPMIRFGTPIFNKDGEKRGVIILN